MIKIVIIEDEIPARRKIKNFLEGIDTETIVLAEIDNVAKAIEFLKNSSVDLIFSDIELLDGNAFDIFKKVSIICPIIFTTAYDQFWMNAFESNGIAYLLKPFSKERFQIAWDKFILLRNKPNDSNEILNYIVSIIDKNGSIKTFKKRFFIKNQKGIYFLDTDNISFFTASESVIFAYDSFNKKHLLTEYTLKEIEAQLNPSDFFRINRSEILNKKQIENIERYTKNTLSIKLKNNIKKFKTSQSNTAGFREWLKK